MKSFIEEDFGRYREGGRDGSGILSGMTAFTISHSFFFDESSYIMKRILLAFQCTVSSSAECVGISHEKYFYWQN